EELICWDWSYITSTHPTACVMDTHTQRYGFGDTLYLRHPEKLQELETLSEKQIILVSPAPVFGIPALEKVQDLIAHTLSPMKVDYERWFEGAFQHLIGALLRSKTEDVIILSGDYHYAMNIQAKIEQPDKTLNIYQMVSSSAKNSEPKSWVLNLWSLIRNIIRPSTKGRGDLQFFWSLRRLGSFKWPTVLNINNVGIVEFKQDEHSVVHTLVSPLDNQGQARTRFAVTFKHSFWKSYKRERWLTLLGFLAICVGAKLLL
ncbi:MAG: hypothetical protein MI976_28650, partial [Pseudomonadales bacterium]|nr:hypothetical protein [Pseudomonadales bacterium]